MSEKSFANLGIIFNGIQTITSKQIPVTLPDSLQQPSTGIHISNAFHYFRIYFNACYYVGFSPYRFKFNDESNSYYIQDCSIRRKIFCIFMQLISYLSSLLYFRSTLPTVKFKQNPLGLFAITGAFGYITLYSPALIYMIWFKHNHVLNILNICHRAKGSDGNQGCLKETITAYSILGFAITCCFILSQKYQSAPILEDTALGILKARAGLMKHNLYLRENRTALGLNEDISLGWSIFTVVYCFFSQYSSTLAFFMETVPVFAGLMIHSLSNNFSTMLNCRSGITDGQILEQYFVFKQVVWNLNEVLSVAILCQFVTTLPYYPIAIIQILDGDDRSELFFLLESVVFVLFAAEANRKFGEFKNLLLQMDPSSLPKSLDAKITMLFVESSSNALGLQAGNLFTISYNTIGTGLSLLTTYVFIGLQFSSPSQGTTSKNHNSAAKYYFESTT